MRRVQTALAMATPLRACTATAPVQLPEGELNALFDEALAERGGMVRVTWRAGKSLEDENLMRPVTGARTAALLMSP